MKQAAQKGTILLTAMIVTLILSTLCWLLLSYNKRQLVLFSQAQTNAKKYYQVKSSNNIVTTNPTG